ncbi:signal peptide, CUB and EGF-like domain-containing protein 2 [Lingula anatina]|uniref:Signal peptide, CUB and EGF-like domain-containing protein 2 n=1 Tax=Lingula anatina TaxID=7574 RepID=A0A1S3JUC9_LINAN|nr:signal peptide, CUB and EGF-like domain-containing protein 2 [Lingula anatina]|eukprot:XP_013413701.1 signal peptide, CUB and EGF-like domain-containing protein 2 [Lingula anatina]
MQAGRLLNVLILATFAILETCGRTTQSPCDINNGQCSDKCVPYQNYQIRYDNLPSGYYCACPRGKALFRGTLCLPRNHPCFNYRYCMSNEKCVPTGSRDGYGYRCDCKKGYIPRENGRGCRPAPVRRTTPAQTTVVGGQRRTLRTRITPAPVFTNLTTPAPTAAPHPCDVNNGDCEHRCRRTSSTTRVCECRLGYRLLGDGLSCEEVDPCENNGGCSDVCIANWPNRTCSCRIGYKLGSDQKTCIDVDECWEGTARCEQDCINEQGSYRCACQRGYSLKQGNRCEDIDECRINNGGCSDSCYNTPGSYKCHCPPGFYLLSDGKNCEQKWKCSRYGCEHNCQHPIIQFEPYCTCNTGYMLTQDQKHCTDMDECRLGFHKCSHSCQNTVGGYQCSCPAGMKLAADQRTCECKVYTS